MKPHVQVVLFAAKFTMGDMRQKITKYLFHL